MRYSTLLAAAAASLAIVACSDSDNNTVPPVNAQVSILDQCDSASFNAGLGAGTCARAGGTTLAAFNAELSANQSVAAWRFDPATLTIHVGDRITAMNDGGEEHTFTEVKQFGGGIVPALNSASGNPTEAPECADVTASDRIMPGASMTTAAATTTGTHLYQCCIHPWMRETVTVTGS